MVSGIGVVFIVRIGGVAGDGTAGHGKGSVGADVHAATGLGGISADGAAAQAHHRVIALQEHAAAGFLGRIAGNGDGRRYF